MHAFNPSIGDTEAAGSLWIWDQPDLQNEFQDNQAYRNPVLKKQNLNLIFKKVNTQMGEEEEKEKEEEEERKGKHTGRERKGVAKCLE